MIWTKRFWKAAAERAIKTAGQVLLATYFVGDVAFNALDADWLNMAGIAAGGVIFSLITSVASGAKDGNPSAGNAEVATPKR